VRRAALGALRDNLWSSVFGFARFSVLSSNYHFFNGWLVVRADRPSNSSGLRVEKFLIGSLDKEPSCQEADIPDCAGALSRDEEARTTTREVPPVTYHTAITRQALSKTRWCESGGLYRLTWLGVGGVTE